MMQSPKMYPGPALNMPRSGAYGYPDARPPAREPSSKILQNILYNFTQTNNYLNNSPPIEGRDSIQDVRGVQDRSTSRERDHHPAPRCGSNSLHDPVHRPERLSPTDLYPTQRMVPYVSPQQRNLYEPPHMPPRYYPAPSSTVTSQSRSRDGAQSYPESYMSPRNRSSSIGSAGSSFRDSRSPSHDSTASRDSASRCSPMSIASSPSPSPPTQDNASKLLGILKGGSYNYPYNASSAQIHHDASSHYGRPMSSNSSRSHNSHHAMPNTVPSAYAVSQHLQRESTSPKSRQSPITNNIDYKYEKRSIRQCQDEPIDLSCKPKRQRVGSVDDNPMGSPSVDSGWGSDYNTPSLNDGNRNSPPGDSPRRSILESILCGSVSSASRERAMSSSSSPIPKPGTPSRFEYGFRKGEVPSPYRNENSSSSSISPPESPCSVKSLHMSAAPSPVAPSPIPSISSQVSIMSSRTRCPWRQTVTLAKKNLLPVSARVSDWLLKIVDFAKCQAEYSGLPDVDKVTLMQHCWARLMLLYMAETNFQFAVTPVHEDMDDGRPPAISGLDPSEPTMDSVELVQNFIKKCQTLQLDPEEFKCLRMYTLFHTGCSGLENAGFVENISSATRQNLQDHIRRTHPDDRLRYSNLLLYLHSLFGVNCGMVQTLFCKHLSKNNDIEQQIRDMLLKREPIDLESDSEEDNETERDILLPNRIRSKSLDSIRI